MQNEELPTLVLRGLESDPRMPALDATQQLLQAHLPAILWLWWCAWGMVAVILLTRALVLPAIERLRGGSRSEPVPAPNPSAQP